MKNTFFKEKKKDGSFKKNLVSLFYAVIAALLIRSFLYEPFQHFGIWNVLGENSSHLIRNSFNFIK